MILTVTLNPALDLTYPVDRLRPGATHRVSTVTTRPGGKGVNVARVLHALGEPVMACGLLGGGTGRQVLALLAEAGLPHEFTPITAETRRTVVISEPSHATGFWEPGPWVSETEWSAFLDQFRRLLPAASAVVACGSLPSGLPDQAYADLIGLARAAGAITVLDTDGSALRHGISASPDVVKPNAGELAAAAGSAVETVAEAARAARALRARGARTVVASLGPLGLVAATAGTTLHARPPHAFDGNPTGAGDAAVAALARGLTRGHDWAVILADAVALSAAAVCSPSAGDVPDDWAHRIRPGVTVTTLTS